MSEEEPFDVVKETMKEDLDSIRPKTKTEAEMDDPFEDPALVTMAFLDVTCQDSDGNSALMLAAAENRILHVKGILHVATRNGQLWNVLEMRNKNGETALDLAVRTGSETAAMLITKFAKEHKRNRHRLRRMSGNLESSLDENDIHLHMGKNEEGERRRLSTTRRPLSRDKISNRMQASDYLKLIHRSRSAHEKFARSFSNISNSSGSMSNSTTPSTPSQQTRMSVGEKLRALFSTKKSDTSGSLSSAAECYIQQTPSTTSTSLPEKDDIDPETEFAAFQLENPPNVRLPPLLSLRRRAASESRRRQFIVHD